MSCRPTVDGVLVSVYVNITTDRCNGMLYDKYQVIEVMY